VYTRTIVSDSGSVVESMQMDTARYRRFSGTRMRMRLGLRMSSRLKRLASLPRSRWVTGTGPRILNCHYGNSGRAYSSSSWAMVVEAFSTRLKRANRVFGAENATKGTYLLLQVPSNGWPLCLHARPFESVLSFTRILLEKL